tara:strand:- start:225 stop:617 length:393 start_codon:yes stop_codon:yes gene_type:complete
MDDDSLELLANRRLVKKVVNEEPIKVKKELDDNDEIMKLLKERLELGKKKYGHGVKVDQNTQDFGTAEDDWELMALEEMLDGLIYTTASIIRYRRKKEHNDIKKINTENIDTENINTENIDNQVKVKKLQ